MMRCWPNGKPSGMPRHHQRGTTGRGNHPFGAGRSRFFTTGCDSKAPDRAEDPPVNNWGGLISDPRIGEGLKEENVTGCP